MSLVPPSSDDGLRLAECVLHGAPVSLRSRDQARSVGQIRPRRRPRSLCHTPMRVDLVANRLPLVESGVATSHGLGCHVRILGEVVTPAGIEHRLGRDRGADRRDRAMPRECRAPASNRPAGSRAARGWLRRTASAPRGSWPPHWPRGARPPSASASSSTERHHELVLHHAAAAVQAVPRADEIERMEERADPLDLADAALRAPCGTRPR